MKRHPHLEPLSDDHHRSLVLARRIRLAAREEPGHEPLTQFWDEMRRLLASELEPHFRVEEEQLFPALEAAGEHALAERGRREHARLRELGGRAPDPAVAAELGELLHHHVRFEERELFPRAEAVLPDAVLEAAGKAALAAREA